MMLTNERTGLNVGQSFHDKYYALALPALIMNVAGYGTCTLQFSTRMYLVKLSSLSPIVQRHTQRNSLFFSRVRSSKIFLLVYFFKFIFNINILK
jgi:hypothetical protein